MVLATGMKHALIIMFFLASSCSFRAIYPAVGAGVGSFGGPVGAVGGAAIGTAMMEQGAHAEIEAKVNALTEGDIGPLIAAAAAKERNGFDAVIDGIYRLLWLGGIIMAAWFVLPWIWARWHVEKTIKKHVNGHGSAS